MNMKSKATTIYNLTISKEEKIKLLNELILDCCIEMEAQDENMRPKVKHNLGEGLRVAKNYLRQLNEQN